MTWGTVSSSSNCSVASARRVTYVQYTTLACLPVCAVAVTALCPPSPAASSEQPPASDASRSVHASARRLPQTRRRRGEGRGEAQAQAQARRGTHGRPEDGWVAGWLGGWLAGWLAATCTSTVRWYGTVLVLIQHCARSGVPVRHYHRPVCLSACLPVWRTASAGACSAAPDPAERKGGRRMHSTPQQDMGRQAGGQAGNNGEQGQGRPVLVTYTSQCFGYHTTHARHTAF